MSLGGNVNPAAHDRWFDAIRAGRAFARGQQATGSNLNHVQLLNPSGSGVTVVLKQIITALGSPDRQLRVSRHDTALATLVGPGRNLELGGDDSEALLYMESAATEQGTQILHLTGGLQSTPTINIEWFAELAPGQGIVVAVVAATVVFLIANFYWMELPIRGG